MSVAFFVAGAVYLAVNFSIAWMLHRLVRRDTGCRARLPDLLVHFGLTTLFGLPMLLVLSLVALFGHDPAEGGEAPVELGARAA